MDLARLARMRRCRRKRHERRQNHGRAWGALRIALVGLVSVFLFCVVSFFALFGYTYARVAEELPELGQYSAAELAQTFVVYDSSGNVVDEL
jgi:penicillin-binding protein 1A